jgi:hypothetical protein
MKHEDDPFDLEKLRLKPEDVQSYAGKARAAPQRPSNRHFTIVPKTWSDQLQAARYIGTYKLAVHLLHLFWRNGGRCIKLTNAALPGITRFQKLRALNELEQLKLIEIERRPRKSPRITLRKTT